MRIKTFLLTILILSSADAAAADLKRTKPEYVGMSTERLAKIKPLMQRYVDEGKVAGIQTIIARKGKIVHFEQVGKLDIDTGAAIEKDSLFRIY